MSKLVAIIDDEDNACPLEHEGYCHIARNKYYKCMEDCDGALNDRPEFCPLKNYIEVIPIEWLKENYGNLQIVRYIMKDWERENEQKN